MIEDVTADITLYAQWAINTYTVSFLDDDGETELADAETINHGEKATAPADPTKAGYNFVGWLDENDDEFNFDTQITADIKLTAKWTETVPILNSRTGGFETRPFYYDLKGQPLGTTKPTVPGAYIEKNGKQIRKISVQ
ncbi:MAG: InlB B-repeat-containing protein [Fibromonadaceae bacterium]|nr:InlB B-repeat-containing protein [Fibromonadaceae bacterium]